MSFIKAGVLSLAILGISVDLKGVPVRALLARKIAVQKVCTACRKINPTQRVCPIEQAKQAHSQIMDTFAAYGLSEKREDELTVAQQYYIESVLEEYTDQHHIGLGLKRRDCLVAETKR